MKITATSFTRTWRTIGKYREIDFRDQWGEDIFVKRVRLVSAAIAAVRYDEKKWSLDIEFREGDTYRYMHVPEFVFRELLKAESAGAFWNSIKDQFDYVKLD